MDVKKPSINYLYFGCLFFILMLFTSSSIFIKEDLNGSRLFFFFHALGQMMLETALLVFAASLIRRYLGKFCFTLFIGGTFIAFVLHILDYLMERILDLSIWEALRIFVIYESLDNFLYLLDASGIPIWAWLMLIFGLIAIPFLGIFIYKMSERIVEKNPLPFRHAVFLQMFLCIPCALFFFDFSASEMIHPDAYTAFIKSLPWKFTFLRPHNVIIPIGAIHEPLSEKEIANAIESDQTVLVQKPNIYLLVIESLREDCITQEIAPNLYQFKNTYLHFDTALSNGNGSHISWFSIFHSQFPFHWNHMQKHWKMGSIPLNILKKWGYRIHLYSSAQLGYYGMDELLFGPNLQLIDQVKNFHHIPPLQAADSDAAAIAQLQKDMAEDPSLQHGQVFIIFLDCTHFDYNWPKDWSPKFTPFATEMSYFRLFQSQKTIELIKNRYANAVNYLDSLFGTFFNRLPDQKRAIVVVMGDHGEEFFEHGHLFHNSHLTKEQLHIPLYFKLGKTQRPIQPRTVVSQMDIFPTILDALKGSPVTLLEGSSLFQKTSWPYAITSRFNGGQAPYEFAIHNGTHKLIAQFINQGHIFQSKKLQLVSLRTKGDKIIPECKKCLREWVKKDFGPALERLFGDANIKAELPTP